MRAATRRTPNDSRATRAAITFELSPLLTAANASASSIPACISTFWSKPTPLIFLPLNEERSLRNASRSWSMIATEWPWSSRMCASVDPTRPHPMITMCTAAPLVSMVPAHGIPSRCGLRRPGLPSYWGGSVSSSPEKENRVDPGDGGAQGLLDLVVGEVVHGGWCVAREPG